MTATTLRVGASASSTEGLARLGRAAALPALSVAATAAAGAFALRDYQGSAAPSPLWAALAAGLAALVTIVAAERTAGRAARRTATAMVLLIVLGWVIQARAPISRATDGGSTHASSAALLGTPRWALVALIGFLAALHFGRRIVNWDRLGGWPGAAVTIGLLVAPLLPGIGSAQNGVRSWVSVGPISGQPGELGRIALILFLAAHLEGSTLTLGLPGRGSIARRLGLGSTEDLLRVFGVVAVALVLLLVQDDLGPAILIVVVAGTMAWAATGRAVYPLLAITGFAVGAAAMAPLSPKVSGRFAAWLHPFSTSGNPTVNGVALQAQARGGLFGRGLGRAFDPYWVAARNDYIVPQVTLRLGLLGLLAVAVLLGVIVHGMLASTGRSGPRGRLVAVGASTAIAAPALLIAAGSTSAFLLTGVAFPFMSYGGTALVSAALLVGLALGAADPREQPLPEPTRGSTARSLGVLFAVLALAVGSKSIATATVDADELTARKDNPWHHAPISLERGEIRSADGVVLARSVKRDGTWHREYPLGPAAAGVVGWVSRSGTRTGAEEAFDEALSDGEAVVLTINAGRQRAAYAALSGRRGAVVALDPRTGAVIALASSPSFDPGPLADPDPKVAAQARARLDADPAKPLLAIAHQERFAPGSVFKIVTAAAAVDAGLDPRQDHEVRSTWTSSDGHTIDNAGGTRCGGDLVEMLEVSCNTTATEVATVAGPAALRRTATALGLDETVPFDLSGAAAPSLPGNDASELETALAGIGQGDVLISPLQATLLAVGGTSPDVPRPHLIAGDLPPSLAPGLSTTARSVVREGMAACIDSGTCRSLRGTSARWAKTGTAEAGEHRNAWVVAAGTELAVTVLVRGDADSGISGGDDAAPIARSVLTCCGRAGSSPAGG